VRKELWAQEQTFYASPWEADTIKVPRVFMERLTDAVCYAAYWLKPTYLSLSLEQELQGG